MKTNKKIILLILAVLTSLVIMICIYCGFKSISHTQKIQQVSSKQIVLYKDQFVPALMGDYKDYKIENLSCNEINPEGQCDYSIKINSTLYIGKDRVNYPVIILFNNSDEDNPKYQYSKEAINDINSKI